jgi:ribA/ribD-fused uncharacterized protein
MTISVINRFRDKYFFLSNFYPCKPGTIHLHYGLCGNDPRWWPTTEHAFHASKFLTPAERDEIHAAASPGAAKELGHARPARPDWDSIKEDVMFHLLTEKFKDPQLKEKLLRTSDAVLVEGNSWHDNFWGQCTCNDCLAKATSGCLKQLNRLGQLLTLVRWHLVHPEVVHGG